MSCLAKHTSVNLDVNRDTIHKLSQFLGFYSESILLFHPRFSPVQNHALRVRLHQIFQVSFKKVDCMSIVDYCKVSGSGFFRVDTRHLVCNIFVGLLSTYYPDLEPFHVQDIILS